jgi:type VI secretion system secreted protein VgrG
VGASEMVLKSDGTITINGKNIDITGLEHVQANSERIDMN